MNEIVMWLTFLKEIILKWIHILCLYMHRRAKGQSEGLRKCVCVYMRKTAWVMQWVCVCLFCKSLNYLQSQTPDTASATVLITFFESIEQTILFSGLLFFVFIVSACISCFLLSEKWLSHFLTWVYKAYWIDNNVFSKTCHVSRVVLLQVIANSHIKRTAYPICIQVHSLLIIRSLDAYSTNPKYMTKKSKCWLQTSFVRTWNPFR